MTNRWLPAVLLVAACGGGSTMPASPSDNAATADAAVRQFMLAVADSNINRMARYWGTSKGPAVITRVPADYQTRMALTQSYLVGSAYRVVGMDPTTKSRMMVTAEFDRTGPGPAKCIKRMPIEVENMGKYGWVIVSMDLNQIGSPVRPCAGPPT
jgi:hypothetical protein